MPVQPESLPDLSDAYPLDDTDIVRYRRDGHVRLSGVLSPGDVAAYRPAILDAAMLYNSEKRPIQDRDTYGRAFLQIMNLWVKDQSVRRFTLARRFARIAAQLMGVDGVRVYHDQALFKEPGGGPTPWHQDQYYWPLDTEHTITMWVPLVPLKSGLEGMTFASESQHLGYLGEFEISDRSDAVFRKMIEEKKLKLSSAGEMQAGDATFHAGWTLHSAPGNPTDTMREVMTVIYFADGAHLTEPDNENRADDLFWWFPGLKAGDAASSKLNPVVYPSGT
ncbi:MAG TPA: phytanoyl-CoA dioxygenase family protein [Armatimonadota bacterium]|jgi:hypothetical protein